MTNPLSPAAQAIWDAFNKDEGDLAAALRVVISLLAEDYKFQRESFKGEYQEHMELIDADDLRSIAAQLEGNPCSVEVKAYRKLFTPGSAAMAHHYVPLDWRALIQQARNENKSISDLYHKHFIWQLANLEAMINNVQKQASLLNEMHFSFMIEISNKSRPTF